MQTEDLIAEIEMVTTRMRYLGYDWVWFTYDGSNLGYSVQPPRYRDPYFLTRIHIKATPTGFTQRLRDRLTWTIEHRNKKG